MRTPKICILSAILIRGRLKDATFQLYDLYRPRLAAMPLTKAIGSVMAGPTPADAAPASPVDERWSPPVLLTALGGIDASMGRTVSSDISMYENRNAVPNVVRQRYPLRRLHPIKMR